jgi:hypothetical protein
MTATPLSPSNIPGLDYSGFPVVVYTGPLSVTDDEMQGVVDAMRQMRTPSSTT